jgi:hypothetical protein
VLKVHVTLRSLGDEDVRQRVLAEALRQARQVYGSESELVVKELGQLTRHSTGTVAGMAVIRRVDKAEDTAPDMAEVS